MNQTLRSPGAISALTLPIIILIKKIMVDKPTQTQLINGRLATLARLAVDTKPEGEYAIIPAVVAEKIAQRATPAASCCTAP